LTVDFGFFGGRFDLALIKDLADDQSPTITAGELVTFTITVFNQGTVTTTNIVVVDYVPDGFTAEDSNWTGTTGTVSRTLAITLSPGLSTTTDIVLRADPALTQTGVITNFAEIAQARDEQNVIRRDVDSTPDNNPNNDGTPVDNATTDPTDEDDHDPARVTVVSNEVVSLGNLVWLDSNNNGLVDSGETGIEGVEVQLFRGTDPITAPPLSTTTTISDGTYLFENLSPGNYVVYLPASNFATGQPLAGLTSSTGNEPTPGDDNTDNDDNGAPEPNGGVVAQVVTLTPGQEPIDDGDSDANSNLTVDFGFFQPLRVGNLVWNDLNDNGFYEPGLGETGINEVVVELYQLDAQTGQPALVGTDTTASGGFYSFENLEPGTYFIRLPASNFDEPGDSLFSYVSSQPTFNPSNGVDGDDNGSDFDGGITSPTFNLVSGQTPEGEVDEDQTFPDNSSDLTIDFGVVQLLTLGNQVWFDNDGNGRIDPGEPSVPEVTVNLLNTNGQVLATTTTDRNGFYLFPGLRPGDYIVEIPATNFQGSGPLAGYVSSGGSTDPNNNIDNDDNGVDSDNPAATGVRSNPVTLTLRGEPSGGGNVNLTVDFGFEARPTFIDLLYFEAKWQGDTVVLTWATQAEIDNFGFEILRSETGSFDDATIIAKVAAKEQPDPDGKRTYSVQDKTAQMNKTYTYWLVDIETDGDRTDPVGDPSRTQVVAPPGTSSGDEEPIYLPVIVR
ncbi:MAG TPA: SdrD B-like domain-containing protein, partial [Anaerolineae bacterium]|nr:SdrD B-like domain-containing protein [Anaerolineae bacterium]